MAKRTGRVKSKGKAPLSSGQLDSIKSTTEKIIGETWGDPVNHPPHYTSGKYEVIDVLEDWFQTEPLLWQVGKYIARAFHKGRPLQDLEKAQWYLARRIHQLETAAKETEE